MCGIGGILTRGGPPPLDKLRLMRRALAHRGPDGEGEWVCGPLGLVHSRLAIIDPHESASQPMVGADGVQAISYNGEIYNYAELRAELEARGHRFRTRSDTEVLLHGFAAHGTDFFARLEGMFAAALWDGRRLVLVRDRFGMKPLFYGETEEGFAFGSEPKALLVAGVPARARPQGLLEYLLLNNTQGEGSIFTGISQLRPGTWAAVAPAGLAAGTYWSVPTPRRPDTVDWGEAVAAVADTLQAAVLRHLVSDVEVGIYLSGGIDSSLIAAAAARNGAHLHSFSLTFDEVRDEAYIAYAGRLSEQFGLQHAVVRLTTAQLPALLLEMAELADEPLGDASDVAVYALSREARDFVKVVLSGDGGDEVFGGYLRHRVELLRRRLGDVVALLGCALPFLGPVNRRRLLALRKTDRAERYASYLVSEPNPKSALPRLLHPDLLAAVDFEPIVDFVARHLSGAEGLSSILLTDLRTILPDTYLRKADRACMMAGVEGRLPYLDRALVELAFSLPQRALVTPRTGKVVLRRLLAEWVPDYMTSAPKMGFEIPVQAWLAGDELTEIRRELARPHSSLADMVSGGALETLVAPPRNSIQAARQWKLLRLGLWAERWLRASRGPAGTQAEPALQVV